MKNVLMTGATSGLGKEMAKSLAAQDMQLFIIARDDQKAQTLSEEIVTAGGLAPEFIKADLLSLDQIKHAADEFKAMNKPLHVLINNAGGMYPRFEKTQDGIDKTMALNYFSLVKLTQELLPVLKSTAQQGEEVRIVNTASDAHVFAWPALNFDILNSKKGTITFRQYAQAKTACMLYSKTLAEEVKADNISVYYCHPGVVYTNFAKDNLFIGTGMKIIQMFLKNSKQGSLTGTYLASSPDVKGETGYYYHMKKKRKSAPFARDKKTMEKLKQETQRILA